MCKPQKQGGQRCAAHTRPAMEKAEAAYRADPTPERSDALRKARGEYASTPQGAAALAARLQELTDSAQLHDLAPEFSNPDILALEEALARGRMIHDANQEARAIIADHDAARDVRVDPDELEGIYFRRAGMEGLQRSCMWNPQATNKMMIDASTQGNRQLDYRVLARADAPAEALTNLTKSPDEDIRGAAGAARNTPKAAWEPLLDDPSELVRASVVTRPDLEHEHIERAFADGSDLVVGNLAERTLTPEHEDRLHKSDRPYARYRMAQATQDGSRLAQIAESGDEAAVTGLTLNDRATSADLDRAAERFPNSPNLLRNIALHPQASSATLTQRLASHPATEVRHFVANRWDAPAEALATLKRDPDQWVRKQARRVTRHPDDHLTRTGIAPKE